VWRRQGGRRLAWPIHEKCENGRELDRSVFFSDTVFASAMTLLVLDIQVPEIEERLVDERLPERLLALWPKYFSYLLSFVVILMYWMAHQSIVKDIRRYDRVLIWLNSLFLMYIAFLPFPCSVSTEITS
jgi:uncharacterized membrane protein